MPALEDSVGAALGADGARCGKRELLLTPLLELMFPFEDMGLLVETASGRIIRLNQPSTSTFSLSDFFINGCAYTKCIYEQNMANFAWSTYEKQVVFWPLRILLLQTIRKRANERRPFVI